MGLTAVVVPESYGGMEMDLISAMIVAEGLARDGSYAGWHGAHAGIGTLPLLLFGTEDQKQKYLPKLTSGEWIGAYALTEPLAGSDALAAKTRADLSEDGSHYVLNGSKMWITNAGKADLFTVFAKVNGEQFTACLAERNVAGLTVGQEEKKMGIKGSSTCAVYFDNVRVPASNLLGEIGRGHIIAFNILNLGRLKLGPFAVGGSKNVIQTSTRAPGVTRSARRPLPSASARIASAGGKSALGLATKLGQMPPGQPTIALGLEADLLDLSLVLRAQVLRRAADPDLARRDMLARAEQRAGREHGAFADAAIVHRHRAHADEGAVLQRRAVDHRHVADHAVLADDRRATFRVGPRPFHMKDAAILHVGARADDDPVDVAAQHAVVPHARVGPDGHVADDPRAGGDEGGFVDLRHLALERQDRRPGEAFGRGHAPSSRAANGAW